MSTSIAQDPVLTRLRAGLEEVYGDSLARVVLFGSRARGDHGDLKTTADDASLASAELEAFGETADTAERIVRAVAVLMTTSPGEPP